MADLTSEQQIYVVTQLARYNTPSETAALVKEEFDGLVVSRQAVARYDPTTLTGAGLSKDLKALFNKTRRAFDKAIAEVPITKQVYRLTRLDEMERRLRKMGNLKGAADLLKQAAEEMGGIYTRPTKDTPTDDALLTELMRLAARGMGSPEGGRYG